LQNQASPNRFLNAPLRTSIEQAVSKHIKRKWEIQTLQDLNDLASHPCAILSDGAYAVFVKLSGAANGSEQFEVELDGLKLLSERSGVHTPTSIGIISVEQSVIILLEALQAVERTPLQWRQIGQALARIHKVQGNQFGLEKQGYFGPLYQDNRPMQNWSAFYGERRLWPRLIGAIDSGNMPSSIIKQVEKLIARLPDLCGPEVSPTLLHGDAQQNNFISTAVGAVVIDPAVYYGNPEIDLAYVDYFQPVPQDVFDGYREGGSIDPGFAERRDLWRIYGYLAAVTVDGAAYMPLLTDALQKYL
jgi:protein-ribulosamine 3-kinase